MSDRRITVKFAAAKLLLDKVKDINKLTDDEVSTLTGVKLDAEKRAKLNAQLEKFSATFVKKLARVVEGKPAEAAAPKAE